VALIPLIRRWLSPGGSGEAGPVILPVEVQAEAWRAAKRKMRWPISDEEFGRVGGPPALGEGDLAQGFEGVCLFYGFGDDGRGNADPVLSGRLAWDYALGRRRPRPWQSPHVEFGRPDFFRLRPGAPPRPKGFYFAKVRVGRRHAGTTVARARRSFGRSGGLPVTGWGPEGFQFICVTHTHFQWLMDERKAPFMALADYEVAPHGFNDFFDAPHLFSGGGVLGLGLGNLEQAYRGLGIPTAVIVTTARQTGGREEA